MGILNDLYSFLMRDALIVVITTSFLQIRKISKILLNRLMLLKDRKSGMKFVERKEVGALIMIK